MRTIGRSPIFIDRGEGAELVDVDGNRFIDYVCSWGPLIHGHAHPVVLDAVAAAAAKGTSFGAPTAAEVELAVEVSRRIEGVDMLRMTSSGTEATMTALRLARAATGRDRDGVGQSRRPAQAARPAQPAGSAFHVGPRGGPAAPGFRGLTLFKRS